MFYLYKKMQKQDWDTEVASLRILAGVKHLSRETRAAWLGR